MDDLSQEQKNLLLIGHAFSLIRSEARQLRDYVFESEDLNRNAKNIINSLLKIDEPADALHNIGPFMAHGLDCVVEDSVIANVFKKYDINLS